MVLKKIKAPLRERERDLTQSCDWAYLRTPAKR